jgi:Flp pilus assembly protein TadG
MIVRLRRDRRRNGATLVETAIVLSFALFLIFSVYEYGRLVMMQQLVENSSREAARFAVANTATATTADVLAQAQTYMCGLDGQLQNFNVSVSGVALQTGPVYTQGTTFSDWTQASPTDGVVVTVSGTYAPNLPTIQFLASKIPGMNFQTNTITLSATSVMYSEGN